MCSDLTAIRDVPMANVLNFLTMNNVKRLLAVGSKQLNSNIFTCPLVSIVIGNANHFQKQIVTPWLCDDTYMEDYVANRVGALRRDGNAVSKWLSHFSRVKHVDSSRIHLNDIPSNISNELTSLDCSEVSLMVTLLSSNKNGVLLPLADLFPSLTYLKIHSDYYQVRYGACFPMKDCLILDGSKLPRKLQTLESSCRYVEFCSFSQFPVSLTSIEMPRTVVTPNIMHTLPPGLVVFNVSFKYLSEFEDGAHDGGYVTQELDQLFASKTWASLLPRSLRHLMLCVRVDATRHESVLHGWVRIAGLQNLPPLLETASFKGCMLFLRSTFDVNYDAVGDSEQHTSFQQQQSHTPLLSQKNVDNDVQANAREVHSLQSDEECSSSSSSSSSNSRLLFGKHVKNIHLSMDITDYPNAESEHFMCTNCYCDKSVENIHTILKEKVCSEELYTQIIFPEHLNLLSFGKICVISTETTGIARLSLSAQEFISLVKSDMMNSQSVHHPHGVISDRGDSSSGGTSLSKQKAKERKQQQCSIKHSCRALRLCIQDHNQLLPTRCTIDYENWDLQTTPDEYHLVGSKSRDFAHGDSKNGLAIHKCNKTHCNVVLAPENRLSELDMCSSRNRNLWTNVIAWQGSNITSLEISVSMLRERIFYSDMMPPRLELLMVLYPKIASTGYFTFESGALAKVKNTLTYLEVDNVELELSWLNEIGPNLAAFDITNPHKYPDFDSVTLPPCNLYNPTINISVSIMHDNVESLSVHDVGGINSRNRANFVAWLTTSNYVDFIRLVTPISSASDENSRLRVTERTKTGEHVSTQDWYLTNQHEEVDMLMENDDWRVMQNITADVIMPTDANKNPKTGKSALLLLRIGRSDYSEGEIDNDSSPSSSVAQLVDLLFENLRSCEDDPLSGQITNDANDDGPTISDTASDGSDTESTNNTTLPATANQSEIMGTLMAIFRIVCAVILEIAILVILQKLVLQLW